MNYIGLNPNDKSAIEEMSALASGIVKEYYDAIIGAEQNDYMIKRFQSVEGITKQLADGYRYYFVCDTENKPVGFLAFYRRNNEMYLSKLYLKKNERGKGISRDIIRFISQEAQKENLSSIVLNVNKYNESQKIYERLGFVRIRAEKIDIGNGYYMDDYVYEYKI